MSEIFEQGQEVQGVYLNSESGFYVGDTYRGETITRIACSMENGQMAAVPWFAVYCDYKMVCKLNAALLHGVKYS